MAAKRRKSPDDVADLLRTMLITQLAIAGVTQQSIRAVVGCDITKVNSVVKHLGIKRATKKGVA